MSGTIKIAGKEIKAEEVKVSCNVDSEQVEFFLDEIEKKKLLLIDIKLLLTIFLMKEVKLFQEY